MYHEGTPLRIFQQLPEASRRSCAAVEARLREAFQPSAQEAHTLLLRRKWQIGQSVEELFYDLVMLWRSSLGAAADKLGEDAQTATVVPFFYAALPMEVCRQLRLLQIPLDNADQLLKPSRTLICCYSEAEEGAIVGAVRPKGGGSFKQFLKKRTCRFCRATDHTEKQCEYDAPVFSKCFKPGHFAKECTSKNVSWAGSSSGSTQINQR